MQENKTNNFDDEVRRMLQDAELEVPARAWKGVQRRISSSASSYGGFWRWSGAALALAAAVAAVLLVWRGADEPVPSGQVELLTAQEMQAAQEMPATQELQATSIPENAVAEALPAAVQAAAATEISAFAEVRPASGQTHENSEPILTEQIISSESETAEDPRQEPEKAEEPGQKAKEEDTPGQGPASESVSERLSSFDELLAQVEAGDMASARKLRRISGITVTGALGSNDAASSNLPSMSSGSQAAAVDERSESSYGMPLSLGVGVRFGLGGKFSMGTGANWTVLTRTFYGACKGEESDITHIMHYVGLPLNIYYDLLTSGPVYCYAYAGAAADFCLSNKYYMYDNSRLPVYSTSEKSPQLSVGGGFGAEFKLSDHLGIYADPGFRYYFPGSHPKSLRTAKPLMFSIELGLKFNLK